MPFGNDLRNEIIILLTNYESIINEDDQIRILAICSKFVNNQQYMDKIKDMLDAFFVDGREFNFWVELPKMISIIIEFNKTINSSKDIPIDFMKFVIYAVIYDYMDNFQSITLNKIDQGDLRICFYNVLAVLLTKPKKITVKKQTLLSVIFNLCCGDDGVIKI